MLPHSLVELSFQLMGKQIPVDHGFSLYGSVCRIVPEFHNSENVLMGLIRGTYMGNGFLDLTPRSFLNFRLPPDTLAPYINLAGKELEIKGHKIRIGTPNTRLIQPGESLFSLLVTTKNGDDQDRFENEISKQAKSIGISVTFHIHKRKTFDLHRKQVVGYSVSATELNNTDSIILQQNGLGGRKKMGCGWFAPSALFSQESQ